MCIGHTFDTPKIYLEYAREISDMYISNIPEIVNERFTVDIPKMYLRCTRDMHEI